MKSYISLALLLVLFTGTIAQNSESSSTTAQAEFTVSTNADFVQEDPKLSSEMTSQISSDAKLKKLTDVISCFPQPVQDLLLESYKIQKEENKNISNDDDKRVFNPDYVKVNLKKVLKGSAQGFSKNFGQITKNIRNGMKCLKDSKAELEVEREQRSEIKSALDSFAKGNRCMAEFFKVLHKILSKRLRYMLTTNKLSAQASTTGTATSGEASGFSVVTGYVFTEYEMKTVVTSFLEAAECYSGVPDALINVYSSTQVSFSKSEKCKPTARLLQSVSTSTSTSTTTSTNSDSTNVTTGGSLSLNLDSAMKEMANKVIAELKTLAGDFGKASMKSNADLKAHADLIKLSLATKTGVWADAKKAVGIALEEETGYRLKCNLHKKIIGSIKNVQVKKLFKDKMKNFRKGKSGCTDENVIVISNTSGGNGKLQCSSGCTETDLEWNANVEGTFSVGVACSGNKMYAWAFTDSDKGKQYEFISPSKNICSVMQMISNLCLGVITNIKSENDSSLNQLEGFIDVSLKDICIPKMKGNCLETMEKKCKDSKLLEYLNQNKPTSVGVSIPKQCLSYYQGKTNDMKSCFSWIIKTFTWNTICPKPKTEFQSEIVATYSNSRLRYLEEDIQVKKNDPVASDSSAQVSDSQVEVEASAYNVDGSNPNSQADIDSQYDETSSSFINYSLVALFTLLTLI